MRMSVQIVQASTRLAGSAPRIVVGRRLRRRKLWRRPWRPPPAPAAASARRSCSRTARPARRCRPAATGSGTSYIAWCRLGSNLSPFCGSNFFTPCFSSTLSNSRSVSSTPSSSALTPGFAVSRSSASSACQRAVHVVGDRQDVARERWRCRSAAISATSRSVRRRRFSISASVRRSRSLGSAFSRASVSTSAAIFASSVSGGRGSHPRPGVSGSCGRILGAAGVGVRHRAGLVRLLRCFAPDIRA